MQLDYFESVNVLSSMCKYFCKSLGLLSTSAGCCDWKAVKICKRARARAFKGNWFKSFWRTASGKKSMKNRNDCMWTSMNRIKQTQIIHMTTDWIMLNTSSSYRWRSRCDRVTALQFQLKKTAPRFTFSINSLPRRVFVGSVVSRRLVSEM